MSLAVMSPVISTLESVSNSDSKPRDFRRIEWAPVRLRETSDVAALREKAPVALEAFKRKAIHRFISKHNAVIFGKALDNKEAIKIVADLFDESAFVAHSYIPLDLVGGDNDPNSMCVLPIDMACEWQKEWQDQLAALRSSLILDKIYLKKPNPEHMVVLPRDEKGRLVLPIRFKSGRMLKIPLPFSALTDKELDDFGLKPLRLILRRNLAHTLSAPAVAEEFATQVDMREHGADCVAKPNRREKAANRRMTALVGRGITGSAVQAVLSVQAASSDDGGETHRVTTSDRLRSHKVLMTEEQRQYFILQGVRDLLKQKHKQASGEFSKAHTASKNIAQEFNLVALILKRHQLAERLLPGLEANLLIKKDKLFRGQNTKDSKRKRKEREIRTHYRTIENHKQNIHPEPDQLDVRLSKLYSEIRYSHALAERTKKVEQGLRYLFEMAAEEFAAVQKIYPEMPQISAERKTTLWPQVVKIVNERCRNLSQSKREFTNVSAMISYPRLGRPRGRIETLPRRWAHRVFKLTARG